MNNIAEQKEALETLTEFNQRLLKNMNIIIKELSGERMDDTEEFLKAIIDAMNWEIGVMNGTMSLLNNEKIRINKETFNEKAIKLATAVQNKKDNEIADAIKLLIVVIFATSNEALFTSSRAVEGKKMHVDKSCSPCPL